VKKLNDVLDGPAILNRVNEIDSTIREHADEAVRARRLNTPVVEAMRTAGVFRMAMPAAWGGPELDVGTQLEVVERLARADASAAWCAILGWRVDILRHILTNPLRVSCIRIWI
jgi:alkylation response protein AidB-like acyl-CoA dehydrogenase